MEIQLVRAQIGDAQMIWRMQIKAFARLLEIYRDVDTNPGSEPVDKVIMRLKQTFTYYYLIQADGENVGAIRVIDQREAGKNKRISPLFILPEHQGKGYAQRAMREAERLHGSGHWELDTILQERGNCYLYEKMGYRQTGKTKAINERMTLVWYEKNSD